MNTYSVIADQGASEKLIEAMQRLSLKLAPFAILRTGGTQGIEKAIVAALSEQSLAFEEYLPWPGWNRSTSQLNQPTRLAHDLASQYYNPEGKSIWEDMKDASRNLFAKAMHVIFGYTTEEPSKFLIVYSERPGTGIVACAIAAATDAKIPVFNFAVKADLASFMKHLDKFKASVKKENEAQESALDEVIDAI
jgi:hypothetical protein